jgi:hypothetical protein
MLLLAALPLALAGCGGSGKGASHESDSAQVVSTTHRYLVALAEADGTTACSLLTPEAQQQLIRTARAEFQTCEGEVAVIEKLLGAKQSAELHTVPVTVASLSGNKAQAAVTVGGQKSVYPLTKTGSGWRLAAASVEPSAK